MQAQYFPFIRLELRHVLLQLRSLLLQFLHPLLELLVLVVQLVQFVLCLVVFLLIFRHDLPHVGNDRLQLPDLGVPLVQKRHGPPRLFLSLFSLPCPPLGRPGRLPVPPPHLLPQIPLHLLGPIGRVVEQLAELPLHLPRRLPFVRQMPFQPAAPLLHRVPDHVDLGLGRAGRRSLGLGDPPRFLLPEAGQFGFSTEAGFVRRGPEDLDFAPRSFELGAEDLDGPFELVRCRFGRAESVRRTAQLGRVRRGGDDGGLIGRSGLFDRRRRRGRGRGRGRGREGRGGGGNGRVRWFADVRILRLYGFRFGYGCRRLDLRHDGWSRALR
mmetsp:Transcript_30455/g.90938  ORF Transcript_30455/g.90938 Transcript_30455/m.90938 type:complete len:326 (+) Transcript_30455:1501-2478(+)